MYGDHRDLHSFPTRRSSDLIALLWAAFGEFPARNGSPTSIIGGHSLLFQTPGTCLGQEWFSNRALEFPLEPIRGCYKGSSLTSRGGSVIPMDTRLTMRALSPTSPSGSGQRRHDTNLIGVFEGCWKTRSEEHTS